MNAIMKFAIANTFCWFAAAFLCLHLLFHQSLHYHFAEAFFHHSSVVLQEMSIHFHMQQILLTMLVNIFVVH
jgi:hypothetical protein